MGLYSDQIAERIKKDQEAFEAGFINLASVVMDHKYKSGNFLSNNDVAKNAIHEVLKFYGITPLELPDDIQNMDEKLEFLLHPSGIMRRMVELTGSWYKDGIGPMLGQTVDGKVIALIPRKISGYIYFDHELGKRIKVTSKNAKKIATDAYCFYNSLPTRKIRVVDLMIYMAKTLNVLDYAIIFSTILSTTLMGLIIPYANQQIFGKVIPYGDYTQLFAMSALLIGVTISTMMIKVTQNIIEARITTKAEMAMQSAIMSRLLSLPAAFFRNYTSGEIAQRLQSLSSLSGILIQIIFVAGITGLLSFIYIVQIAVMTPVLAVPAILIVGANITITIINTLISIKILGKQMEGEAKLNGLVFTLISGIQKIKVSGSEKRAFSKWAIKYSENANYIFAPPVFMRIFPVLVTTVTMFGTVILFTIASYANVSVSEYMAFNAAFGLLSGSVLAMATISTTAASIKPILNMAKPIMDIEPEISVGKKVVSHLSGTIHINNISFRYTEDMPLVLDSLSLKVNRGQYVAIVGASSCGKSTLLRLLLGFEEPQKGAIYYDSHDIKSIDLKSLRKSIGCVVQNGTLMTGSIYENITISAPCLTMDDAWEAAEMAGVADEIREMPMGMHTLVADGGGSLSGGQKQRILIARAIAPKPKIIFLDEATSALDNITQKHVSQSLDNLKCTRIVIAHRLSTIRQCDRIIMLEKGRIVEDGTYDELMALNKKFADLVERQRLEG